MLIRGQTTEQRIAEIANSFAKGISGAREGMQSHNKALMEQNRYDDAKSRQAEAEKRQRAIQAIETANNISANTGKFVPPAEIEPMLATGDFSGLDMVLKYAPESRKAQMEGENRKMQTDEHNINMKIKNRQLSDLDKPFEQSNEYKKAVALAGIKNSAKPSGTDRVTQKQMEKLGVDNAQLFKVKGAMDEALTILNDPSVSEDQKIKTGQSLFKLLNSAEGSDAVGAEEASRLGSYLEYNLGNFTQPGAFVGRDLGGFTDQVANYSKLLGGRIQKGEEGINLLKGGGSLGSYRPGAQKANPQHVEAIKSMSDADLLKFVQGG